MSKNRYAANTDKNQPEVVKTLRQIPGVSVETGHDDFIIGYRRFNLWVEWKSERAMNKKGKVFESCIKDSQKELRDNFRGVYMITGRLDDILSWMKRIDRIISIISKQGV